MMQLTPTSVMGVHYISPAMGHWIQVDARSALGGEFYIFLTREQVETALKELDAMVDIKDPTEETLCSL